MKSNLKTMIASLGLVAVMATAQVFALDGTEQKTNAQLAVPPAVHPAGEETLTFSIGAAYTFWQPFQGATNLAYSTGAAGVESVKGKVYAPNFNAQSGFKVNLGANVDHDGWNVMAQYTWFYNNPAMTVYTIPTDGASYSNLANGSQIYALQGKFKNQFNRIDAVLDRAFFAGHYLAFRPFIGLLGAWDTQNLYSDASIEANVGILFDAHTQSTRISQSWWGIGPYAGIDSSYFFTNEWAIFLNSGVSMLLANHDLTFKNYTYTDSLPNYILNYTNNLNAVEPMLEGALGMSWEKSWNDEWALRLQVSWELQTYLAHSGFETSAQNVDEDYSMQGLTIGLQVSF